MDEPVAYGFQNTAVTGRNRWLMLREEVPTDDQYDGQLWTPLYTAPPKKEWIGLTDDDVDYFVDAIYKGFDMKPRNEVEIAYFERLIKFVGAKLEDKNT
jgi:hypothetical protein